MATRFCSILFVACLALLSGEAGGADPPVFPKTTWTFRSPHDVGLDARKLDRLRGYLGGRGCVVRKGFLVYSWGDVSLRADVASACKPVFVHLLFKAVEEGRIESLDTPVFRHEPRLQMLNAALGFKDRGITWKQLACQTSCYGVTEAPGAAFDYSDFNMALLFDTLVEKVFQVGARQADAEVLHPRFTAPLNCEDRPTLLAFGVDDRPGRVGISVRDFARFGLLYLRQGEWNGKALIRREQVVQVVTSPAAASLPRTRGKMAEMIPGQRSLGGGNNQTGHFNSYSFAWWTNGVGREGSRHWPHAPADAFAALGHGGRRGLVVIPSFDLVLSWNDAKLTNSDMQDRTIQMLAESWDEQGER